MRVVHHSGEWTRVCAEVRLPLAIGAAFAAGERGGGRVRFAMQFERTP
jgi:hypothetical protein